VLLIFPTLFVSSDAAFCCQYFGCLSLLIITRLIMLTGVAVSQGSQDSRLFSRPLCLSRLARFTLEAYCVAVSFIHLVSEISSCKCLICASD